MDFLAILSLIDKGVTVANALVTAAQNAQPAFDAVKNLISNAKSETITVDMVEQTEAVLDQLIADFNLEMPE